MAKSTGASSGCSRIGIQPPTRSGSGARPFLPRGSCVASADIAIPASGVALATRFFLRGLPWVALVEAHAHVATRAGRSAEADLVPGGRVRVIGGDDVVCQPLRKEHFARHTVPSGIVEGALLHLLQQRILLGDTEGVEPTTVSRLCLLIQRAQASAPSIPHLRQPVMAIPIGSVLGHLVVDQRSD